MPTSLSIERSTTDQNPRALSDNSRPQVTLRELMERRMLVRGLNGMIQWGKSKLDMFPFDAQVSKFNDIYQVVIKVQYVPLPIGPEIVYEKVESSSPPVVVGGKFAREKS